MSRSPCTNRVGARIASATRTGLRASNASINAGVAWPAARDAVNGAHTSAAGLHGSGKSSDSQVAFSGPPTPSARASSSSLGANAWVRSPHVIWATTASIRLSSPAAVSEMAPP